MKYIITQELLQATVGYLQSRPFGEVYQLINALTALEKVEGSDKEEEATEETK